MENEAFVIIVKTKKYKAIPRIRSSYTGRHLILVDQTDAGIEPIRIRKTIESTLKTRRQYGLYVNNKQLFIRLNS